MGSLPQLIIATVLALAVTWLVLLVVLVVCRPRGMDAGEAARLVPDLVRTIRSMSKDPDLGRGARAWLGLLLIYLVSPIDLVPDLVPGIGHIDDVIVTALVLRHVVGRAGSNELARHWAGSEAGLELVERLVRSRGR